jgi:hypothetical protein
VLEGRRVGEQDLRDAVELGGGFGDRPSAFAAVSALLVESLSALLSCSASSSVVIRSVPSRS